MARFSVNFISYTLHRAVDITVVIPGVTIPESMGFSFGTAPAEKPSHAKKDPYPVLYLLHGYGNNHATWSGYARAELFAEERNIAVVMLSAENKFYLDHGGDDNYFEFTAKELPEFTRAMFPVSSRPEDTFIAGLSMGGFGALAHGFSSPENFAAIGAFSAAVLIPAAPGAEDAGVKLRETFEPLKIAKKAKGENRKMPKIFLTCGEEDFLFQGNVRFKDELVSLGFDVTWESLPGYRHEWRFWDLQLEKFLDWLPRSDAFSGTGKRSV